MNNRKAHIRKVLTDNSEANGDSMYVVNLYENDKLVQTRELPGKSIHYAEDVVENWESGAIQLLTE